MQYTAALSAHKLLLINHSSLICTISHRNVVFYQLTTHSCPCRMHLYFYIHWHIPPPHSRPGPSYRTLLAPFLLHQIFLYETQCIYLCLLVDPLLRFLQLSVIQIYKLYAHFFGCKKICQKMKIGKTMENIFPLNSARWSVSVWHY